MKDGSGIVVTTLRLVSRVCATSFNVVTGIIEATEHVKANSKVKLIPAKVKRTISKIKIIDEMNVSNILHCMFCDYK